MRCTPRCTPAGWSSKSGSTRPPTPPALHGARVRVGGDLDRISDLELAEIGVTREHAADYLRFMQDLIASLQQPVGRDEDLVLYRVS
jgi:hypothetical protein